jgi:hypothetical protein
MQQGNPVLDQFVEMTRNIIEREGIEGYLPTILLVQRKDIRVLEGVPDVENHENIALEWASKTADSSEDFLLAFKSSSTQFKVIARVGGQVQQRACDVHAA